MDLFRTFLFVLSTVLFILGNSYFSCNTISCTKPNVNNRIGYRLNGSTIEWFSPAGLCGCLTRCYRYGNCFSVNYHKTQLNCTINARRTNTENPLMYDPGWEYIEIPASLVGSEVITVGCNSCQDDHVCVVLKSSSAICIGALSPAHSDVVLLLDVSGSINDSVLANQKTYAKQFLPLLKLSLHGDHLAAYTVTDTAVRISPLSWDENAIITAIDNLADRGGSSDYSVGVDTAYNYLQSTRRRKYRAFIVGCTDEGSASIATPAVVSKANAAGITVITAGLLLSSTSLASRPEYFYPTDHVRLLDLSDVIAEVITRKYN